jgi:hypothetical protein
VDESHILSVDLHPSPFFQAVAIAFPMSGLELIEGLPMRYIATVISHEYVTILESPAQEKKILSPQCCIGSALDRHLTGVKTTKMGRGGDGRGQVPVTTGNRKQLLYLYKNFTRRQKQPKNLGDSSNYNPISFISSSVADPDPDLFGRIRIRTSGTGSGS